MSSFARALPNYNGAQSLFGVGAEKMRDNGHWTAQSHRYVTSMASRVMTTLCAVSSLFGCAPEPLWTTNTLPEQYTNCTPSAITPPSIFGIQVLNIDASPVINLFTLENKVSFCNITVTYTHPGQNDVINIVIWLPASSDWNGLYQAQGGGGWVTGFPGFGAQEPVAQGYVASWTDGGHAPFAPPQQWALASPGNVNMYLLQDFASVGLHDMATVSKDIIKSYYGVPPKYSYWSGCSTGGRQGLMLAQRYPHDFDGILATAPAMNWDRFVTAEFWPLLVMNELGEYPPNCEFNALTEKAIEHCDGQDGVIDGVISAPGLCDFDPFAIVGEKFDCNGEMTKFTQAGAFVAQKTWEGARKANGDFLWYGNTHETPFWGMINNDCPSSDNCRRNPFGMNEDWISTFLAKDASYNCSTMTYPQFEQFFHDAVDQYHSIIGTANPDLSGFRAAGGKMITWHGLADQLIMPNGTSSYYDEVLKLDPKARDFYRYFEVPGALHCSPGGGAFPQDVMGALRKWVEHGEAPETLHGRANSGATRELCQYPLVAKYISGDPGVAESYKCSESF